MAGARNGARSADFVARGDPPHAARIKSLFRCYMGTFVVFGGSPIEVKRNDFVASAKRFRGRRRAWREKSRRVAVTLPEFSFCFSYSQSGGRGPPPFNSTLARLSVNAVSTSVFRSSSLQEWPQTMQCTWFSVAVRLKNGRKMTKNLGRFCRKGFFGFWRLQNGSKQRYLHGFVHLPGAKPCKLRWFWAMSPS